MDPPVSFEDLGGLSGTTVETVSRFITQWREAGAVRVWLAGKGGYEGVDGNVYAGCDAIDVLNTTLDDLGVNR